jgi:hypothetical protein
MRPFVRLSMLNAKAVLEQQEDTDESSGIFYREERVSSLWDLYAAVETEQLDKKEEPVKTTEPTEITELSPNELEGVEVS